MRSVMTPSEEVERQRDTAIERDVGAMVRIEGNLRRAHVITLEVHVTRGRVGEEETGKGLCAFHDALEALGIAVTEHRVDGQPVTARFGRVLDIGV